MNPIANFLNHPRLDKVHYDLEGEAWAVSLSAGDGQPASFHTDVEERKIYSRLKCRYAQWLMVEEGISFAEALQSNDRLVEWFLQNAKELENPESFLGDKTT